MKKYALKPCQERVAKLLKEGHMVLQQHRGHSKGQTSLDYIEGVAKVRFALSVIAELLNDNETIGSNLLIATKDLCTDVTINYIGGTEQTGNTGQIRETAGPASYFLKLIVRQYGISCLTNMSVAHTWIIPPELKQASKVNKTGWVFDNAGFIICFFPVCTGVMISPHLNFYLSEAAND